MLQSIARAGEHFAGQVRRVFLADGDALVLPTRRLLAILQAIRQHHAAGKPILAECGGMLYCLEQLSDRQGRAAVPWAWADKQALVASAASRVSCAARRRAGPEKGRNVGAIVCPVELNLKKKRYAGGTRECYSPTSTLPATTRTGKVRTASVTGALQGAPVRMSKVP